MPPHANFNKVALYHLVQWVSRLEGSAQKALSWQHVWVQDLAQYYCFARIPNKRNKRLMLVSEWVAHHYWKISNNYISNDIPGRFYPDLDPEMVDVGALKDPTNPFAQALYKGVVLTCESVDGRPKANNYCTGMVVSSEHWAEEAAVRGRASAVAGVVVALLNQPLENKTGFRCALLAPCCHLTARPPPAPPPPRT